MTCLRYLTALAIVSASTSIASASGLIWSLPDDGAWVRYEGQYTLQAVSDADAEGSQVTEWIRHLVIKSVGQEQAEYNGSQVLCRWIEIKVITGTRSEAGIDPGPAGERIYKVLVPESGVIGDTRDETGIPVSMLPIVKGFRRTGEGEVMEIGARALLVYPSIALLTHYPELELVSPQDSPTIRAGSVQARHVRGTWTMERANSRSTNIANMWVSNEIPFGLAKWTVSDNREIKDFTDPRSAFRESSRVTVEMSAHQVGLNAESELDVP